MKNVDQTRGTLLAIKKKLARYLKEAKKLHDIENELEQEIKTNRSLKTKKKRPEKKDHSVDQTVIYRKNE